MVLREMASTDDTPKASKTAAAAAAPESEAPVEAARYPNDALIEGARALLSTDSTAVAGALSRSNRKTHTLKEAETLVREYLRSSVEHDNAERGEE